MPRTRVSVTRCADYEPARVRQAVHEALGRLGGLSDLLAPGRTVLLKPNLLSSTMGPERPVNTHPAIVRAVAEYAGDRGCRVQIGDSCGRVGAKATEDALEVSGVRRLADAIGAEVVNFDRRPAEKIEGLDMDSLPGFDLCRAALDADVVFDLPKLKTHGLTYLTGAVKNMFGCVPGKGKKTVHRHAPKPAALAEAVVEVFARVRPQLTLMDGIVAMEGRGPNSGAPREVGVLLAGRDAVAVDAVAAAVCGFEAADILTTRLAAERGLGVGDLGQIEVVGEAIRDVRVPDFRKPFSKGLPLAFALLPDTLLRWIMQLPTSARSRIDAEKCVLCGQCVANCPSAALSVRKGKVVCDRRKCIACYCCEEVCDYDAAHVTSSRALALARRVLRVVRRWGSGPRAADEVK